MGSGVGIDVDIRGHPVCVPRSCHAGVNRAGSDGGKAEGAQGLFTAGVKAAIAADHGIGDGVAIFDSIDGIEQQGRTHLSRRSGAPTEDAA